MSKDATKIEEVELLRIQLHAERSGRLQAEFTVAQSAAKGHQDALWAKYGLGDKDQIMPDGQIVRAEPAPVPLKSVPPEPVAEAPPVAG